MTAVVLAFSALAGCTYRGGDIGDPAVRKFHWYSYLEGEDIRANCQAGTPDRFRVVYTGLYDQQLRMYEVDSLRRVLSVKVVEPGGMGRLSFDDPMAPSRAREERVQLNEASYHGLVAAFAASGVFAPPPVGLELPSRSYHWTAATCRGGRYGFTAWKHPSPAFAAITFDKVLFGLDFTGIPVAAAGPVPFDPQLEDRAKRLETTTFTLKVGENGLGGW
ncbi:hypothetical protein [Magnetospirillum sp. UT-4]|uniref:hypothetical protein n=1 Tax=Magnetospirillum sp. UT-4 TaxID=2681467 RepID=UPI0020C26787|nr:hypothetical protein [Magnetospirillum sp. UT-4]